jgi:microcin C transport system substrate-binding protein
VHPRLVFPAILLAALAGLAASGPAAWAQAEAPAAATGAAAPSAEPAEAATPKRRHALSLVGEPKHGPDFKHFDWVNPDAPKGGTLRGYFEGTFDSLNPFTVKGVPAASLGLVYDSLLAPSPDEPSAGTDHRGVVSIPKTIHR